MNKSQPNSHLKVDTKSNTSISSEAWQSHLPFFYLLQGGCGPALFWLVGTEIQYHKSGICWKLETPTIKTFYLQKVAKIKGFIFQGSSSSRVPSDLPGKQLRAGALVFHSQPTKQLAAFTPSLQAEMWARDFMFRDFTVANGVTQTCSLGVTCYPKSLFFGMKHWHHWLLQAQEPIPSPDVLSWWGCAALACLHHDPEHRGVAQTASTILANCHIYY